MKNKRRKSFLSFNKIVAILLSISLGLSNGIGYADPNSLSLRDSVSNKTETISIPEALGKIEESFFGPSGKAIIYIQDAHDSLEAQENIAKAIHHFVEYFAVQTVFEEGFEGPVPTDEYFGFIKNPVIREKMSYFLMDKLRLGGAEYAHINRKKDFKLIGADSIKLHLENIEWYRKNARHGKETEKDLAALQREIAVLVDEYFPKELKEWLKLKDRFEHHKLNLLDYLKRTVSVLPTSQNKYPAIDLLLSAENGNDKEALKKAKTIEPRVLFEEINHLEDKVAANYLRQDRDLKIFQYYKGLELFRRLNQIELTSAEYEAAQDLFKKMNTRVLAKFIVKQRRKSIVLSNRWEKNINQAMKFYETASERDHFIEKNIDDFLKSNERTSVLVFGGFHKDRLKEIFRNKGLSYIVVSPKISDIDKSHKALYRRLMANGYALYPSTANVAKAARLANEIELATVGGNAAKSELRSYHQVLNEVVHELIDKPEFMNASPEHRNRLIEERFARSEMRSNLSDEALSEVFEALKIYNAAPAPKSQIYNRLIDASRTGKWIFIRSADGGQGDIFSVEKGEFLHLPLGAGFNPQNFSFPEEDIFIVQYFFGPKPGKIFDLNTRQEIKYTPKQKVEAATLKPAIRQVIGKEAVDYEIGPASKGIAFYKQGEDEKTSWLDFIPGDKFEGLPNLGRIARVFDIQKMQLGFSIGSSVSEYKFSPDGKWLSVSYYDGRWAFFNAETGQDFFNKLKLTDQDVGFNTAFSPDGKLLSVSHGETASLFDISGLEPQILLELPIGISNVELLNEKKILASASLRSLAFYDSNPYYFFDLETKAKLDLPKNILKTHVVLNGKRLLMIFQDGSIKMLDPIILWNNPYLKGFEKYIFSVMDFLSELIQAKIIKSKEDLKGWLFFLSNSQGPKEQVLTLLKLFIKHAYKGEDPLKLLSRYNELYQNQILPLPQILASNLSPEEIRNQIQAVREGQFDISNSIHVDLNYFFLKQAIGTSPIRREISYAEFLQMIGEVKRGKIYGSELLNLSSEIQLQMRGLIYEGHLLRKKILSVQDQARKIGKEVIVVENLSYGAVATSPIAYEEDGKKYIVGTKIPVWGTKVGSTESHHNEHIMKEDLFSAEQMEYILKQQPIIIIVDASTSVSDPERTSPHIPDAFKGYRNHFMAINEILGQKTDLTAFHVDEKFLDELRTSIIFQRITKWQIERTGKQPYSFGFYYPGNKGLYLRQNKKKQELAPKLVDDTAIKGPIAIFIQTAIEPEAVPQNIKNTYLQGRHEAAFFDDSEHFKEFFLEYAQGYGFQVSRTYINEARRLYGEFVVQIGEPSLETKKPISIEYRREADLIMLDLDGTITETDRPLSQRAIKALVDLLAKGKKIIIATEDIEKNLDKRFKNLPQEITKHNSKAITNLIIVSDGATLAYHYQPSGEKEYWHEYNDRNLFQPGERQKILHLIETIWHGKYEIDTRSNRISPDRRIDLRNVQGRDALISQLNAAMAREGLSYRIYKAGSTSIKIVKSHKEDFLKYHFEREHLAPERVLIIANSAKTHEIDRRLLSQFPNSTSINVGETAETIKDENPNIIQTQSGIEGALSLLERLAKYAYITLPVQRSEMRAVFPYTQEALTRVIEGKNWGVSVLERFATPDEDGSPQPSKFYSISGLVFPDPESRLQRNLIRIQNEFKELPFFHKFFPTPSRGLHLSVAPMAEPKPRNKPFSVEEISQARGKFLVWIKNVRLFELTVKNIVSDPDSGRIQAAVLLPPSVGGERQRAVITLLTPYIELTEDEKSHLSRWLDSHQQDFLGTMPVRKISFVYAHDSFAINREEEVYSLRSEMRSSDDLVRRAFNAISRTYAKRSGNWVDKESETYLREFIERLPKEGEVLDAGTGPGHKAAFIQKTLREKGDERRVVGIDFAEKMIEEARELHPEVEFQVADLRDLHQFKDHQFAGIVLDSVLHNQTSPDDVNQIVEELRRILRPDGILFIKSRAEQGDRSRNDSQTWIGAGATEEEAEIYQRRPETPLSAGKLRALLNEHGFHVISLDETKPRPSYNIKQAYAFAAPIKMNIFALIDKAKDIPASIFVNYEEIKDRNSQLRKGLFELAYLTKGSQLRLVIYGSDKQDLSLKEFRDLGIKESTGSLAQAYELFGEKISGRNVNVSMEAELLKRQIGELTGVSLQYLLAQNETEIWAAYLRAITNPSQPVPGLDNSKGYYEVVGEFLRSELRAYQANLVVQMAA